MFHNKKYVTRILPFQHNLAKLLFFVWSATLGEVIIIDKLVKRGMMLANWCLMCK